jgi:hypothetical protein
MGNINTFCCGSDKKDPEYMTLTPEGIIKPLKNQIRRSEGLPSY